MSKARRAKQQQDRHARPVEHTQDAAQTTTVMDAQAAPTATLKKEPIAKPKHQRKFGHN
ncbi:hypothetical protein [Actinomadura rupiterrae]|uniref:hypothetical protein n=1 Tax=Actinomadura rupiterrae TaxID=559627 RepID=UPI0020A5C4D8|nr:hypothetical protein [Actinomadura rupiterrae]MCP2340745.1 hypothetical protein [Actinomadura rupiterrae]